MIEKAIAKINVEIQMAPNNVYRARVGEYIIDHILSEDDAAKVLDKKKSLGKALEVIFSKARAQAIGDNAWIEDSVVFGWAMKYFGLQDEELPNPQTTAKRREEKTAEKPVKKGVVLALEDFFS
ncbi:Cas9 inhibitor AcrIIA9 family protein [Anaerotignum sp.]|uniref:Cas9 inhibitor AcrIIA9 family protein n=1 Tax=Anaerotignum sp. TaxID=2039241 RepID=UPI0028969EC1|nr:Cas9 inhibitor AcrIIA9 family protein [Anaerotignum sp.]